MFLKAYGAESTQQCTDALANCTVDVPEVPAEAPLLILPSVPYYAMI